MLILVFEFEQIEGGLKTQMPNVLFAIFILVPGTISN